MKTKTTRREKTISSFRIDLFSFVMLAKIDHSLILDTRTIAETFWIKIIFMKVKYSCSDHLFMETTGKQNKHFYY